GLMKATEWEQSDMDWTNNQEHTALKFLKKRPYTQGIKALVDMIMASVIVLVKMVRIKKKTRQQ
ncbi:hypothetical protein BCR33DRAFT_723152, partial [Rhizoclosmatium globosum]